MKTTSAKAKSKRTKTAGIVVNGKRSNETPKMNIQNLSLRKIVAIATVLIFGAIGVYMLAQSLAGTPTAYSSTFNVTTWNSNYANKTNVGKSARALGVNSDIIGIQEAHKPAQRKNIKNQLLCSSCKYQGYIKDTTFDGSSPASLPIVWDKNKFKLVEKGYVTASAKKTGIKDETGKNAQVSAKYITWVRLRDKATNRSFYVVNLHTVASVEKSGLPNKNNKARLDIYKKNMDALVKILKGFKKNDRPIIVLGDLNVNYRTDSINKNSMFPYARLSALGLHSSYEQLGIISKNTAANTEGAGNRLIDYIFTLKHARMTVTNEYVDPTTYGSDHHPVSSTATIYATADTPHSNKQIPIGTSAQATTEGVLNTVNATAADAY